MGKLFVVGIGPGDYENMTIRADRALAACEVIVGYQVYVDLIKARYPNKEYISTPMTREAERCQIALKKAREGRHTAMICSGDSGIYGMAALLYELRAEEDEPEIEIVPGLTAACSGAALLGAPLTDDFAVISLSDRLTRWEKIEERLEAAAKSDLSIAVYNPASRGRPGNLKKACELLLHYLPGARVCGVCRNIGRAGESCYTLTLEELKDAELDMFCTVFIGNESTRIVNGKMITPRGYKNA